MTHIPYQSLPVATAVKDRRAGLAGWGVVMILIGALLALLLLVLFAAEALRTLQSINVQQQRVTQQTSVHITSIHIFPQPRVVSLLVWLAIASGMIWTGIASIRLKRWVRPIVIIGCVAAIGLGVLMTLDALAIVVTVTTQAQKNLATARNLDAVLFGMIGGLLLRLCLFVALPWVMLSFYRSEGAQRTLLEADPQPRWTDRCPTPVLGWSLAIALLGLWALGRLDERIVPFFSVVLTRAPAIVVLSMLGILALWGAWLCFRLDRAGWYLTTAIAIAMAASTITFAMLGDASHALLAREMPDWQMRRLLESPGLKPNQWNIIHAVIAAGAVGYALWIRKFFPPPTTPATRSATPRTTR